MDGERLSLRELWERHESEPFPAAWVGRRVEGHCLLTLDAQAAGCARAFFAGEGFLGYYGAGVLLECHTDLSEALEAIEREAVRASARGLPADGAPEYILRMHELTGRMLGYISGRQAAAKRPRRWWQRPARSRG